MDAPTERRDDPLSDRATVYFAGPMWIVRALIAAILLNAFATALLATALILHLTHR